MRKNKAKKDEEKQDKKDEEGRKKRMREEREIHGRKQEKNEERMLHTMKNGILHKKKKYAARWKKNMRTARSIGNTPGEIGDVG